MFFLTHLYRLSTSKSKSQLQPHMRATKTVHRAHKKHRGGKEGSSKEGSSEEGSSSTQP